MKVLIKPADGVTATLNPCLLVFVLLLSSEHSEFEALFQTSLEAFELLRKLKQRSEGEMKGTSLFTFQKFASFNYISLRHMR